MRDYNYRKNWNDLLTPEIVKKLIGRGSNGHWEIQKKEKQK